MCCLDILILCFLVFQESIEETAESKELQIKKLEETVKSLSEELIKVCEEMMKSAFHVIYMAMVQAFSFFTVSL